MAEAGRIRIDKWLWQARFFKSRTLAAERVAAGAVRVNGQRISKPAHDVGPGDVLTFSQGGAVRVVRMIAAGTRRGPAAEARLLYAELGGPPAFGGPAGAD